MADAEEAKLRQEIEINDFILANVPLDEPPPSSLEPSESVASELEEDVEGSSDKATLFDLRKVKLSIAYSSVDKYDLTGLCELRRSSSEVVHLVKHKDSRAMARKTIQLQDSASVKQVHRELDFLRSCQCENITDLRPANLLVNRTGQVKLCGMSCVSATLVETMTNSAVGSRCYMSPECLDLRPHGAHSEVWSFGITLTELAMGRYPYPPASVADRRVLSQKRQLLEGKQWNSLRQLIKEDQKKRAARDVKDDKLPHYITYGQQEDDFLQKS
ncbi:mitogen-activated protein kinase kinase 1 [Aphelenchoides avenae]|nr:mitogen-activated protein kinase kinase 1 [Aphelenchus avenae]